MLNSVVNFTVLAAIVVLTGFAVYALWDSQQVYQGADSSNYAVYKPAAEDGGKSFQELQSINPEVIAWLTVYGTNIDYPVTQGRNNMKYINTNAEGAYSLSGAIFLDFKNSGDFSDFNSILYGHHMEKRKMFGEIGDFSDRQVFETHRFGNLYYGEKDHGIEFFAFVHCDAYDKSVFTANMRGEEVQKAYLDGLHEKASNKRSTGVTIADRIILLSTCSSDSTNGRDVLIGRITDEVYEDTFYSPVTEGERQLFSVDSPEGLRSIIPRWLPWLILIMAALIAILALADYHRKRKYGNQ